MNVEQVQLQLEQIGLNKSEVKVYLSLLDLGPSKTGPILEKSKIASSKIYLVLEKLIDKGLVTFFKQEGLKFYKAAEPSQLLRYLKDKEHELKEQEEKIKRLLPALEIGKRVSEYEAVVFKGPKAIKTAFNELIDSLNKGDQVNIMGVYAFGEDFKRLAIYFQKLRSHKGIKGNFLMNKSAQHIADTFAQYPPLEVRFMEEGLITPAIFLIYQDKVIINLTDELVFFRISSQRTADAFNAYFQHLWKRSEKYVKNENHNT